MLFNSKEFKMLKHLTAVALCAMSATAALAVPITITPYGNGAHINTAINSYALGTTAREDFENFGDASVNSTVTFETGTITRSVSPGVNYGELTNIGINTRVGTITTFGNFTGTGSTCGSLDLNRDNCSNIALQYSPDVNGQGNIAPLGGLWSLNAADTGGFVWSASSALISKISTVVFAIRDAADTGATVAVSTVKDGVTYSESRSGLGNDNLQLIEIDFGLEGVSSAEITIASSRRNDSMTLDGLMLIAALGNNENPAPVPLPATGLLLAGALGALKLRSRAKRAA